MKTLNLSLAAALMVGVCCAQNASQNGVPAEFRNHEDRQGKLKPGDSAVDFSLKTRHSEKTVTLSSFKKRLPVALVFGSYT